MCHSSSNEDVFSLVDFWSISLNPAKDGRVIYVELTLTHHLFNISVGELIPAVPANAQDDEVGRVVPPLKG
jgi:hypothetical protein